MAFIHDTECSRPIAEISQTFRSDHLPRSTDDVIDHIMKRGTFGKNRENLMIEEWLKVVLFIRIYGGVHAVRDSNCNSQFTSILCWPKYMYYTNGIFGEDGPES